MVREGFSCQTAIQLDGRSIYYNVIVEGLIYIFKIRHLEKYAYVSHPHFLANKRYIKENDSQKYSIFFIRYFKN